MAAFMASAAFHRLLVLLVFSAAWAGCAHHRRGSADPLFAVEAYAAALTSGELETAWKMGSPEFRKQVSLAEFKVRYAAPQVRQARSEKLRANMRQLRVDDLVATRSDGGWWIEEPWQKQQALQTLSSFVSAIEASDFTSGYALLSAELRGRYTPERFARDFASEPSARERVQQVRMALRSTTLVATEQGWELPLGGGKNVLLVREADGPRVAAIE